MVSARFRFSSHVFCLLAATFSLIPQWNLRAADGTWIFTTGGTSNWSEAAKWSGTIADGAGFTAFMANANLATADQTIVLDTSRILGAIRLGDNNSTDRRALTISSSGGTTLTFDNTPNGANASLVQISTSAGDTISAPVVLNSSLDVMNTAPDRTLTISGAISAGTAGLKVITNEGVSSPALTTNPFATNVGSGPVTLSGIISDGLGQVAIVQNSPGNSTLALNGANTFTGGVTLNQGTLTLGNATALGATSGKLVINSGYLNSSISNLALTTNNPVEINGNFSFFGSQSLNLGTGAVTFSDNINITSNSNQLTLGGNISDGGNGYSLTKTGQGRVYLTGTNTYTGGTTVNAGFLIVNKNAALGGTGRNVAVNYGATVAANYAMDQAFVDRVDTASVGTLALWTNSGAALNLSAFPNMRLGSGNNATYSGTLTPHGTTFRLGGGSSTLTVSSALTGAGNSLEVGIQGSSVGNVTLSGNNTYGGSTTVRGPAVLQLNGNTGRIADTSDLVMAGNGTFRYDNTGATAAISETLGVLRLEVGDSTVLSQRTLAFDSTLTFASFNRSSGATVNFTVGGAGATTALQKVAFASAPTAGAFLDAGLFVSGANYAAYDAAGFVRALDYTTDSNTASVGAGATLATGSGKHVNLTGSLSAQTTDSIETLRISNASNVSLASGATLTVAAGGILKSGASAATIDGGTGITVGGGGELVIRTDVAADQLNLTSNILSTTGALTKSGAGVVALAGTNAYTGQTTVNAGTLRILGAQALGSGDVALNGGTLDLRANGTLPNNGGTPETFTFGQNVVVGADATIAVNTLAGTSTQANKTIRMGNLSIGGNVLTVTNNNGYGLEFSGTTTLSPGATGNTVLNLATAKPSNLVQALTLSGKVTGSSQLTIRGGGMVQLTNSSNDFVGNILITGGGLAVSSDGALGNAANQVLMTDSNSSTTFRALETFATSRSFTLGNNVATNNIFQVVAGKTFTLNSAFLGNNGFVKSDNGTFEINAANTGWDGTVIVQDGVLKISNSAALGSTEGTTWVNNQETALHLNGGASGITVTDKLYLFSSGLSSTGALLSLTGSGANTVSGDIVLNGTAAIGVEAGSTLNLTSANAITAYADLTASGTTTSNTFSLTLTGAGNGTLASPIATGASTLIKTSTGTWTLTGTSTFTGTTLVNNGTLILSGAAGKVSTGAAWQLSPGATLVLDNTSGHLDNRLGTRGVHFGGNLTILGDASAPTLETITSSNLSTGNTAGVLTLDADPSQSLTFQVNSGSFTRSVQGTALFRGDNLGNTPGAGVATMKATTAPTFVGQTGAAGTANRGILPWAIVDQSITGAGTAFATYDSVRGIMALNAVAGEELAHLQAGTNVALEADRIGLGAYSINSLNLRTSGGVEMNPMQTLNIESGGLLAFTGNSGIQGGLLSTSSNRELIVHGLGDLEIGSVITGTTGGLTKTGAGTLSLTASNLYTGATTVNQGTLKLAGGHQTLLAGQPLNVNTGGTLDLNGTTQMVGALRSLGSTAGETPMTGGIITSTNSSSTLVINETASTTFAGQITGEVTLIRSNGNTLNLTGTNSYTGATVLNGGVTSLRDGGKITESSSLDLSYGALRFENNFLTDDANRLADDIGITLRGGTLSLYGRGGSMASETVGLVSLAQGSNIITAATGSNNGSLMPQSATLTLSGFTRDADAAATVNFGQSYSGTSSERLGLVASTGGSSENIVVTGGLATTNNIVGPWAIVTNYFNTNAAEFAGYDTVGGVGALNTVGFAGYDGSALPATSQPTQNIRLAASGAVAAGGLNINSLNFIGTTATPAPVISFANATDVLNLTSGGLSASMENDVTFTPQIGATPNQGRITAGGINPGATTDLFIFYQNKAVANLFTINSAIIDNPTNNQAVRLVVWGGVFGQFPVVLNSNLNSYTGGTVVNSQILQIGTAGAAGNLPAGGLTLNGGTVTQINGTIAPQDVTLNGPSVLTLTGSNTLNNVTFNNTGGSTNPVINVGSGTLTLGGDIAVTSSNVSSTATISGGTLSLGGSTRTVDVAAILYAEATLSPEQAALNISSAITGTGVGLIKTGDGFLQLSGASTFSGGIDLQAGGLVIGASTTGTVTSGPLGTGTLTLGQDTTLTADGTARTVSNAVAVGGDFTLGVRGPTVPAALTLSGAIAWGSSVHTVTVNSAPGTLQTISGTITGSGGLVKTGIGTLALTGNNTASLDWRAEGAVTVENGSLRINNDNSLGAAPVTATPDNIVLNGGSLSVGANVTLNSNRGIALGEAGGSGTGILEVVNTAETLGYAGIITDNGTGADNLLKTGTGTLLLSGVNTYTGNTTIAAGTLTLGATGSLNDSARISVLTGATFNVSAVSGGFQLQAGQILEGGGSLTGAISALSGSIIAPGTSLNDAAERLSFGTGLNLASGSTLQLQITTASFTSTNNFGGNAYGSLGYNNYIIANAGGLGNHDQVSITGTLDQATGAKIQVLSLNFTPQNGQIFNLVDWTTAFNSSTNLGPDARFGDLDAGLDLDLPDISGSGLFWDTSHFATLGVVVVVPEPGRAMLLVLGLMALFGTRRRGRII